MGRRVGPCFFRHGTLPHRLSLVIAALAITGLLRLDLVAAARPPIADLRGDASCQAARPDQFKWQEQSPSIVAIDDCARDQVAGHRGGVEAVSPEAARQPYA